MAFVAAVALALAGAAPVEARQLPDYRPSSLADLVKAVSVNRDGLDQVDLTRIVADHRLYLGDAVGIASRFIDDPNGALFVGWQRPGESWRYRFLDDAALRAIRAPADAAIRLGRVESLRLVGSHLVLETHAGPFEAASVVMTTDLAPVAHVAGSATLALPGGGLVVQRSIEDAGARLDELAILDPGSRRIDVLYAARQQTPARAAFAARLAAVSGDSTPIDVSIASLRLDATGDTLAFTVTLSSRQSRDAVPPLRDVVAVRCVAARAGWSCSETRSPAAAGR